MQETEDIVTRLEKRRNWVSASREEYVLLDDAIATIATIATLRAEVEGLRDALKQIVNTLGPDVPKHLECDGCAYEWHEALKIARAAIDAAKAGKEGA